MNVAAKLNTAGCIVLGTSNAKHLYEIGVRWEHPTAGMQSARIEVHANTRTQAAGFAKKAGYDVRDVNMVG